MNPISAGDALVSVVVPAYNAAATIRRTLDSALAQTYSNREIIVVDDGSADSTVNVLEAFGEKLLVLRQRNQGPAAARNSGLAQAKGKYVAFLDADDSWRPDFLKSCLKAFQERTDLVAVSTGGEVAGVDGAYHPFPGKLLESTKEPLIIIEEFFEFWGAHDHIRTGNCVIRRNWLVDIGGQNEKLRLAEDLELWALLGTCGKWAFIPQTLWVCDSVPATINAGWELKYRDRRRLAPTVDQWQARILPRLKENELADFRHIRGRVAAILAHNNILGGNAAVARGIASAYGTEMPHHWSAKLMNCGARWGSLSWFCAVSILRGRELQKSFLMRYGKRRFLSSRVTGRGSAKRAAFQNAS